jgi:hypothetical protein
LTEENVIVAVAISRRAETLKIEGSLMPSTDSSGGRIPDACA